MSIGSVDAGTAGGYVLLQDKVLTQSGRYTIEFESVSGVGNYDANVFVGTTGLITQPVATKTWIGPSSGNWGIAANWSGGTLPTATDIVEIGGTTSVTVTLDISPTVAGLILGGTAGTQSLNINGQTLTLIGLSTVGTHGVVNLTSGTLQGTGEIDISGQLNWNGGTLSGTGLTVIGPSGTLAIGGSSHTLNRTIENQGLTTWSVSPITQGRSSFLNKGTFVATTASTLDWNGGVTGGTNAFFNQGIFQKQGTGTVNIQTSSTPVNFDNSGLVDVQGGAFQIEQGSATYGQFDVDAGATLAFKGGKTYTFLTGSTVTGPGSVQVNNDNLVVNTTLSISTLAFSSGSIGGTGDLTLTGASTWSFGTMSGTGRTIIAPSGSLGITGGRLSRVLENQGTVTESGSLTPISGQILNTNLWVATTGSSIGILGGPGGVNNRFTNQGIFRKQGTGTVQFFTSSSAVSFENQGTLDIQAGTLGILNNGLTNFSGTTLTGGTYQISGTGVLQFTGANVVTNAANIVLSGTAGGASTARAMGARVGTISSTSSSIRPRARSMERSRP